MMVNCPKCGFSQPKDTYCAQCGIDMVSFRPEQKPFVQRLVGSLVFQLSVLAIAFVSIFSYVRYQNRVDLRTRIANIENAPEARLVEKRLASKESASTHRDDLAPSEPDSFQERPLEKEIASESPPTVLASTVPQESQNENGSPPPQPADDSVKAEFSDHEPEEPTPEAVAPAPTQATQAHIVFYEASRALLDELEIEGRSVMRNGHVLSGIVGQLDNRLKSAGNAVRKIDSHGPEALRLNSPIEITRSTPDEAARLSLYILPIQQDENITRLQIDILRSMRDPNAVPPIEDVTLPIPNDYVIPKGGAAFFAGVLPRRPLSESEENRFRGVHILNLLTTEAYKSGATDLVVIIEPK